jgi:hypothetical protein
MVNFHQFLVAIYITVAKITPPGQLKNTNTKLQSPVSRNHPHHTAPTQTVTTAAQTATQMTLSTNENNPTVATTTTTQHLITARLHLHLQRPRKTKAQT